MIRASEDCDERSAVARRRRTRRVGNDVEVRAARAEALVQVGELFSARQALEGAELAPGNRATLGALRNTDRRPPNLRDPLPPELVNFQPTSLFQLDEDRFLKNLRSARRGAAASPSGMTNEHLRLLLDDARGRKLLFAVGEQLARAAVPEEVIEMVRVGRLTALTKPDGGVRGIVVGDTVRRLVARTIAQQLATTVEKATAPYQYALSTRAGCECIAHALQGLTEINPEATVTSIDGIGAFDLISRESMMTGLRDVAGGGEVLPFVRMFYGVPSEYLWEDDAGDVHKIPQGEGGEQGDP